MFQCKHCSYEYTYKESLGMASSTGVGKRCPNCGETNYYTARSRRKGMFITMLSVLFVFTLNFFEVPMYISIGILFILLIGYYLLFPFLFELTDQEDPLW
uniref:TIGR04104 family putative zinc finger protein n=1 Tax=uncultured Allobacillus sp. TaxID=1638025 RepID=UPI002594CD87|nr:TIGR04104 family putative zinc finger protein [uncultured Allobacillus sp.]